jgi:hypothetical protein
MRQYAAALDGVKAQATTIGAERTKPGSFDALCVSYYRSPDFLGLRPSTQSARRHVLERFRRAHGSKPLRGLHCQHITTVIGAKADTPEAAKHLLKTLRIILSYAIAQGMLDSNPAAGIKKYRSQGEGHHSWSESENRTVRAASSGWQQGATGARLGPLHGAAQGRLLADGMAARNWRHHRGAPTENRRCSADPDASAVGSGLGIGATDQPDIPDNGARRAVHFERVWQLVARPLQRGRPATLLVSWTEKGGGNATSQCRMQRRSG